MLASMRSCRQLACAVGLCWLLACGGAKPTATSGGPPPGTGSDPAHAGVGSTVGVALEVTPRDAIVEIDDIAFGKAATLDPVIALAPGLHTLVVTHEGHKTYRAEFSVTDKTETFVVKLTPR
jgi:hypothetical protein